MHCYRILENGLDLLREVSRLFCKIYELQICSVHSPETQSFNKRDAYLRKIPNKQSLH